MNIPVEISVGCEIVYFKEDVGILNGTVINICGDSITIEGPAVVHIKKIIQFTFGGVWMINHKYDHQDWNVIRFLP